MDSTITISLEEVSNSSTQIKSCSSKLTTIINDLNKISSEINSGWSSTASDTFRDQFKNFVNKFNDAKEAIENYAKFLDQTVEVYKTVDEKINSAAQG